MMFSDPEKRLQRYIDFRSQTLPKLCSIVFILVSVAVFYLSWDSVSMYPMEKHLYALKNIAHHPNRLNEYFHLLEAKGLLLPIAWHLGLSLLSGLFAAFLLTIPWWKRPDRIEWLYIKEGSEVIEKAAAGVRALKKKAGIWQKKGIQIYKGRGGTFSLPYELESKHQIYMGSVGTGKTASMLHSINSLIERGDKAVVYCYKGDFTEWLGGMDCVSILGFADARSDCWHISRDINTPLLARELAQTLIAETSPPIWSSSARDVLAGVLEYLIATKPDVWGFKDVSDLLNGDRSVLVEKLHFIQHGSVQTIDKKADDKAAESVILTLRSGAWIFDVLSQAWENPCEGFSIRDWLKDESPEKRIIILRNYPDFSAVSNWLLGIMFNQLFGEVLALKDSKTRRVWAVIDELATLPAIPRLPECLVASRSKGFRFLCGIQNFASMREKYGANIAQTIFSQFATKIICRVTDAETATTLATDMGGQRRISRAEVTRVKTLNEKGENEKKWHVQWRDHVEETHLLNNQIMILPDPTETGCVTAWLYIAGFPICKLEWDFLDIEATAPVDVPVIWMDEALKLQHEAEELEEAEEKPFKPKPFPKGGRLSKPVNAVDDFENLDDVDGFPDAGDK